ncbi:MAG: tetratricopeptide repeat protein [Bacteroidota bacterium]
MKISSDKCLTYEQLEAYSSSQNNKLEYPQLYSHISLCEMCNCAVKGFNISPFTNLAVLNLHDKIDKKAAAGTTIISSALNYSLAGVSIILILIFYNFVNSFSENRPKITAFEKIAAPVTIELLKNKIYPTSEIVAPSSTQKDGDFAEDKLPAKIKIVTVPVKSIKVNTLVEPHIEPLDSLMQRARYSDVRYIYDFKVVDYDKLYFKTSRSEINFKNHTSPINENNKTNIAKLETDIEQTFPIKRFLEKGLYYFKEKKYNNSISEFQQLLQLNSSDINALFYTGMAFYNMDKYDQAIEKFNSVLSNDNSAFFDEAKWNLALAYLKLEERQSATQMLLEIISENGFYTKHAAEKLRTLK